MARDRSKPTGERTAEERERDREERARRRGELPDTAPPDAEAPAEPPSVDSDPAGVEPGSAIFEPEPAVAEPPPIDLEPDSVEPGPAIFEPVSVEPELAHVEPEPPLLDPQPLSIDPEPTIVAPESPPPPSRPRTLPGPPPLPPELGGRAVKTPKGRASRSWLARVVAVLALLAAIAAVLLLAHSLRSEPTKTIPAPVIVKVLIPEGRTRAQIAEIAHADHLGGAYAKAAQRSPLLNPVHYGAPKGTTDLEGFLFPATYDMDSGAPVSTLVEAQLTAFRENFTESEVARAHTLHVTPYQLLTVASMVEREAQIPGDRAKIAAVIYNRLREGVPLGIDATIYYAVEQQTGIATYTHELTEAQLHIDSPYNTRLHKGLPPTPISNPGDASIHAAAYPAQVSYLYYVAGADGCGEQVFSNTLAEFEANDAAYQAAVKNNGGKPPTCKKK